MEVGAIEVLDGDAVDGNTVAVAVLAVVCIDKIYFVSKCK